MSILSGILPLYKPAGMTSHDCVMKVRRITRMKRVGHTGTLDPGVTGVLPICIGPATKVADYLHEVPKVYRATMKIGTATDTQDASGVVVERKSVEPPLTEAQVRAVLARFIGEFEQVPPMYSAVKVGGKRLHEWARQGKTVERKPRRVTVYEMTIENMALEREQPEVTFTVTCSKGTYIRTLCVDIGAALGFPAHMTRLQRIKSGPFTLDECVTLEQVEQAQAEGRLAELLYSLDQGLTQYPAVTVPAGRVKAILNGLNQRHLKGGNWQIGDRLRLYSPDGSFLALHEVIDIDREKGVESKPVRVFPEGEA
ncbi:tRNA pseudouridine(55) synthase TruB [Aneurinibacillus thermoaerophilus]|uniref:tRNA pseudouridine synthase B n=1 Tax=Aneurinibacillus thermoaerophilus TaxID=143495 RepID=A0A1G7WGB5_ANETH|nr:tRNA pseudouridine(55) synthase TruB [Aneurinibacillus thermoaerophilus]MED0756842.1 tRNA pseudouridine(55) synthase TruB [Aneurinibacillus thermoaerophilus]MED0760892.1 tRNA pseudouridine(55) synthase TruB [Aneurinibacillus thermoaerophilus]QYY41537.1 tRNA pseudouridine(55) synthase TruB [Aneurinibacillus thermoaerophilus]SDG71085.1 tRNA pseudouridine synthase B [Aneurinibacillus thermoaerophilus]